MSERLSAFIGVLSNLPVLLALGVAAIIFGLFRLRQLWVKLADPGSFLAELPRLLAHVPHGSITAADHILAGVPLFVGLSLTAASLLPASIWGADPAASVAGLSLGVLTLCLVFWTLHQTSRLTRLQGDRIDRFDVLIRLMTDEVNKLVVKWDDNRDKSSSLFRIYMVTNNPYFGVNSYPGKAVTLNFSNAMNGVIERGSALGAPSTKGGVAPDDGHGFRVVVMCASKKGIAEFNGYYGDTTGWDLRIRNNLSEKFIAGLQGIKGANVIRLDVRVAEMQFVVIGDVVFEFILEDPDDKASRARGSNIRHTTRIDDPAVARRFERYLKFLQILSKGAIVNRTGIVGDRIR